MVKKAEFIWNTIGSFIYAMFSAIILAFCTRINGVELAGVFLIAYTTSTILNSIGEFGIRIYQSTDVERKFKFFDYFSARVISIAIMFVVTILIVTIGGYTKEKLLICILLSFYRLIDNISETFQGEFQLNNRLDLSGMSLSFRSIGAIIAFIIGDILTKNIVISCLMMVIANTVIFLLFDIIKIKQFNSDRIKINLKNGYAIVKECLPIAISSVMNIYVINAVKYAIDATENYTMQTYFNIIYMPSFVINLLSIFLIRPFLVTFGEYYTKKEYDKLSKIIWKIIILLFSATAIIEVGCFILGIPFLNIFYNVDVSQYKMDLLILVSAGFFYALANLFFNLLGTIRKQKYITISYIIVSIIALTLPKYLVATMGMRGTSIASITIMGSLSVILGLLFLYGLHERRKQ